jgi:hypothetical protein
MRTDELIRGLAADASPARLRLPAAIMLALAAGLAVSVLGFAYELGPRDDVMQAARTIRFVLKPIAMLLIAGAAALLALRLAQPAAPAKPSAALLAAAAAVLAIAVALELIAVPASEWRSRLIGSNALVCLVSIPLLAAPVLGALLYALRGGAPLRPALSGAVAGLLSGALGGALYALHCTDDSPLFVAFWYGIAMTITAAVGAVLGRLWLRW